MIDLLTKNGYSKVGYGYKKLTDSGFGFEIANWVTIFSSGDVQMYGYNDSDPEGEKDYDTGIVKVTEDQLQTLIDILVK